MNGLIRPQLCQHLQVVLPVSHGNAGDIRRQAVNFVPHMPGMPGTLPQQPPGIGLDRRTNGGLHLLGIRQQRLLFGLESMAR